MMIGGKAWGQTVAVNDVLLQETFGTGASAGTTFSATNFATGYNKSGTTTFVASDKSNITFASSNAMLSAASGANMTDNHVWLNKNTSGYLQISGIPLYNAAKIQVTCSEGGGDGFNITVDLDGGTGFTTNIGSFSAAGATLTSSIYSITGSPTTLSLRFTHKNTANNVRIDNIKVIVTEIFASCPKPTNFASSSVTASSATISWAGTADAYKVEYKKSTDVTFTTFAASQTATTANLSGLSANTTYNVKITGICSGEESVALTGDFTTTCTAAPSTPVAGTNVPATNGTSITWNWSAGAGTEPVTGYKYNTTNNYSTATTATGTSYNQTGLLGNTPYTLYVWAYNDCGVSLPLTLAATTNCIPTTITLTSGGTISGTYGSAPTTNYRTAVVTPSNAGTVTYSSGNENVVTINPATGAILAYVGAGTSVITATLTPDAQYCAPAAPATYTFTVNKATPFNSYQASDSKSISFLEGTTALQRVRSLQTDAPVTYTATPAGIVSIDEVAGIITFLNSGVATITANCDATANYNASSAVPTNYYTLTITCPAPTVLVTSAITTSSATISWTGGAAGMPYKVEYQKSTDGTNWTTFATNQTATTANLSNLSSGTTYNVKVTGLCGPTGTSTVLSGSFTTVCEDITNYPFTEGFEGYTGTTYSTAGVIPNCWFTYAQSGVANYTPHITGSGSYNYPHSGTNALTFTAGTNTYGGNNTYAVLPKFDMPLKRLSISFWYATESASNGTLSIGYITGNQNNVASFVELKSLPRTTNTTPVNTVYRFKDGNVPPEATYIAIRWSNTSTFYSAGIDDINVDIVPFEITAAANPAGAGTFTVNGNNVTVTPAACYEIAGIYTINPTTATTLASSAGNVFTFTAPTEDVTVTFNFTPTPARTVTLKDGNGTVIATPSYTCGTPLDLTSFEPTSCNPDYTFAGWVKGGAVGTETTTTPNLVNKTAFTTDTDVDLWAVYKRVEGVAGDYLRVTASLTDWSGDYLIAYSNTIFFDGSRSISDIDAQSNLVNPGANLSGSTVLKSWGDNYKFTLEAVTGGYVLRSTGGPYIYRTENKNGMDISFDKLTAIDNPIAVVFNSNADIRLKAAGNAAALRFNTATAASGGQRFRFYADAGQTAVYLYKLSGNRTTYYLSNPVCPEPCSSAPELDATDILADNSGVLVSSDILSKGTGDCNIIERGFIYSTTNTNPEIGGNGVVGPFTVSGNDFETILNISCSESTYYIRSYAVNDFGTGYGAVSTFNFAKPTVAITTDDEYEYVNGVFTATATIESSDCDVLEYGFVYGLTPNPTTDSCDPIPGEDLVNGIGQFIAEGNVDLGCGVYYFRAFAVSAAGTGYSNEVYEVDNVNGCISVVVDNVLVNNEETVYFYTNPTKPNLATASKVFTINASSDITAILTDNAGGKFSCPDCDGSQSSPLRGADYLKNPTIKFYSTEIGIFYGELTITTDAGEELIVILEGKAANDFGTGTTTPQIVRTIYTQGNTLVVNALAGDPIEVYNILGQPLTRLTAQDGETRITVPSGILLVRIAGTTTKVVVR